jgi:hypothetical protein
MTVLTRLTLRWAEIAINQGAGMGQPVAHFEVIGRDGKKLQSYYGIVQREGNTNSDGVGMSRYPTSRPHWRRRRSSLVIGLFSDPEGHAVGVVSGGS